MGVGRALPSRRVESTRVELLRAQFSRFPSSVKSPSISDLPHLPFLAILCLNLNSPVLSFEIKQIPASLKKEESAKVWSVNLYFVPGKGGDSEDEFCSKF